MSKRLLAIILSAGFSAISAVAQTGCITGTVFDDTGAPLSKINVEAQKLVVINPPRITVQTDANGKFEMRDIPAARYEVSVDDYWRNYPGTYSSMFFYGKANPQITVAVSDICEDVVLRVGPQAAKLQLKVYDAITREPIQKPTVNMRRSGEHDSFSTWVPDQKVLVPSLAELQLEVQAAGYEKSAPMTLAFQPGEVRELSLDLQPAARGCLTGAVVDAANTPMPGVRISTGNGIGGEYFAITDAEGKFKIGELNLGPHSVWAGEPSAGYEQTLVRPSAEQNSYVKILPGQCRDISIKLVQKAARLRVNAIDAVTGKSLPHTDFVLTAPRMTSGGQLLGDVILAPPLMDLTIEIRVPGYEQDKRVNIGTLAPDEEKEITIALQPLVTSSAVKP